MANDVILNGLKWFELKSVTKYKEGKFQGKKMPGETKIKSIKFCVNCYIIWHREEGYLICLQSIGSNFPIYLKWLLQKYILVLSVESYCCICFTGHIIVWDNILGSGINLTLYELFNTLICMVCIQHTVMSVFIHHRFSGNCAGCGHTIVYFSVCICML